MPVECLPIFPFVALRDPAILRSAALTLRVCALVSLEILPASILWTGRHALNTPLRRCFARNACFQPGAIQTISRWSINRYISRLHTCRFFLPSRLCLCRSIVPITHTCQHVYIDDWRAGGPRSNISPPNGHLRPAPGGDHSSFIVFPHTCMSPDPPSISHVTRSAGVPRLLGPLFPRPSHGAQNSHPRLHPDAGSFVRR